MLEERSNQFTMGLYFALSWSINHTTRACNGLIKDVLVFDLLVSGSFYDVLNFNCGFRLTIL